MNDPQLKEYLLRVSVNAYKAVLSEDDDVMIDVLKNIEQTIGSHISGHTTES